MENKEEKLVMPAEGVVKQLSVIILIGAAAYFFMGPGFRLPLALEMAVVVFVGTFFLTWTAYPFKEFFRPSGPGPLLHAAACASSMGALTTILGMMLLLGSIDDVSQLPRRLALTLSGLFYGLLLSEVVFAPLATRFAAAGEQVGNKPGMHSGAGKRVFLGLLSLGVVLLGTGTVLFALAAPLKWP